MEIYLAGHDATVSLDELRADVQDAYDRGLNGQRAFTPETVGSLLDLLEEQHAKIQQLNASLAPAPQVSPIAYKLDWPVEFGVGMKRFTFDAAEAERAQKAGATVILLGRLPGLTLKASN